MTSSRPRKDAEGRGTTLIRLSEAAALVDVHVKTLRRWISEGKLTGYRLASNQIRIDQGELLNLARPMPTVALDGAVDRKGVA
ncbi:helix-turn-helix domain-containing protein [Nocardia macrotermitis]|uniref:Helix-turn-helix domain-containing protein n=1 Tax=Nocardia macrotermitis TaxID=2585198 RepID=A0A7K0DA75_9NOCA|nr:helix-turn-helix domain-containing protein [Nocardia macrotermitis]MQY22686.1 hypothetical protein [Nocardia macrotermitis]